MWTLRRARMLCGVAALIAWSGSIAAQPAAPAAPASTPAAMSGAVSTPGRAKPLTQFHHDVWQTEHGLPQNSVRALLQRRDGYLWFGTETGLVRFDGVHFTVFDRQSFPVLKDPDVTALFEDDSGRLWVGTDEGLVFTYTGTEFVPVQSRQATQRPVQAIAQDGQGRIWIAAGNRISHVVDGVLVPIEGSAAGIPYDFIRDGNGILWIATSAGLAYISGERVMATDITASVHDLALGPSRALWLATSDGVWQVSDRGRRHVTVADGLPSNQIRTVLEDHTGAVWVGTAGGGVARYANGVIQTFTTRDGLSDAAVTTLAEDREGSIWIGTLAGGLNRLRDVPFAALTRAQGLASDDVTAVYEDRSGKIWIGTDGAGLTCLDGQRAITYTTDEGLPSDVISTVTQASDGSIWVGTGDHGLARFSGGDWVSFANRPEMPQGGIRAILEDQSGTLWIANRDGLHRIRAGTLTTFTTAQGLSSTNISSIEEDHEGTLWIGTFEGGLNRYRNGRFTAYTTAQGLSSNDVSAILADGRYVWVGTLDGRLHVIRNDRALALPPRDGATSGRALSILDDERGSLWMSGQRGLTRFERGDLLKVANGAKQFAAPRIFDRFEGFGRWEFHGDSNTGGWRLRDGRLLFASANGVIVVDPAKVTTSRLAPPVRIERLMAGDRDVPVGDEVELPDGGGPVEFHYTALSFAVPGRVQFRYRLEGVDQDWIDAGTRRIAYYPNLPGGRYTFQVLASNQDGVWTATPARLALSVRSRFYETRWFYGLCGLVLLAALGGLSRVRVGRLRARQRRLEQLVDERTSALRQEIGERQRMEESLRQSKEELEDRVRERTNELAVAYAQLQADVAERRRLEEQLAQVQKLESIGRLAGGVAHDLNNVLTVVLSYSDLLDAGLGAAHPLQAQLRQIRKAAERASNLTHRLLAFARQQVLEPRVINLSELTLSLDGMLRRLIGEDIEVVTVTCSGLWSVRADPHQIEQVLVNLAVNARDAMPNGGKLTIGTSNVSVTDDDVRRSPGLASGEYVLLTVTDTGTGMDEHVKRHLFEPFFTTKELGKGTGLGLATCYGIVHQLGGHILPESELRKGTIFRVYLPKVDLPAEPSAKPAERGYVPGGSETVLLVEDEPLVRQIAESALSDQGYRVLEAENGEEALRVATAYPGRIALVLTDVVMPRMGGREMAESLRELRPGIRVLYMSGYAASTIDEQDVVEPGTAFLRKPFTLAEMLRKVREVLDERRAGEAGVGLTASNLH